MENSRKKQILKAIAEASHKPAHLRAVPPDVIYAMPAYVPSTRKFLYHIIMRDGEGIYGYSDRFGNLYLIDAWDWLSMGGLHLLAYDWNLEFALAEE